jgi:molecular chaperone DnaK
MTSYGIDFGTTNSVLSAYSSGTIDVIPIDKPPGEWEALGFAKMLPSVLGLDDAGGWHLGWSAKKPGRRRLDAVKRLLAAEDEGRVGDQTILVEEAAAALFTRLREGARSRGVEFDRAVVTVPANSKGRARARTKVCAGFAGIETMYLLNEPTAAAMAYGSQLGGDDKILVVDFGGGTLDVTLLHAIEGSFIEQASRGIGQLGGIDFDKEIATRVRSEVPAPWDPDSAAGQQFMLDVELAKVRLSNLDEVELPVPGQGSRRLTRREVAQWIEPRVSRVEEPIRQVLHDAGMTMSDIDHLVLVGGSCKVPAVRERVIDLVGREPARGIDPMTAVAEGAAVAAAILDGDFDGSFHLTTEHALGTIVRDPAPGQSFSVILDRNATLPADNEEVYVPVNDHQESIMVTVVEGDPSKPLDDDDTLVLSAFDVPITPRPFGESAFSIRYSYDREAILHVTVTDSLDGTVLLQETIGSRVGLSPQEMVQMHGRVEELVADAAGNASSSPEPGAAEPTSAASLPPEIELLLTRARDKVMPLVAEEEAERFRELADALESALGTPEESGAQEALESALRRYSYLF